MLSSSTDQEMLLGRLLVERGIVDRTQLQAALDTRQGSRLRLGAVLKRSGMVSAEALRSVLTEKVRCLLLDALAWTDGNFFFDTGPLPKRSAVAAIVDLAEVLALPAKIHIEPAEANDVIVTDDDIIEIIELTRPRRAATRNARKRPIGAADNN